MTGGWRGRATYTAFVWDKTRKSDQNVVTAREKMWSRRGKSGLGTRTWSTAREGWGRVRGRGQRRGKGGVGSGAWAGPGREWSRDQDVVTARGECSRRG